MSRRKSMKVLIIGAEDEENLAVRYLASYIESRAHRPVIAGYSMDAQSRDVLDAVRKTRPGLIAVSIAFQSLASLYFDLIAEIRKQGYNGHIIVGGHFPTFEFRKILETQPGVDSVGRFDGEETVAALADALASGQDLSAVPNLVYRANGGLRENECLHRFPDLDALPFPLRSRRLQKRLGESFATLVSSRGCWHSSCLYCCIGAFHRQKEQRFALRSAESVAREIASLVGTKGARVVQFHDDNFMLSTKEKTLARIEALTQALRECRVDRGRLAFLVKARPDVVDDETAEALRDFGCVGVFLGIENASSSGLKSLIRAATPEHIDTSFLALRSRGIAVTYNLLVFHPKATLSEIDDNIRFPGNHLDSPFDFGRAEIVAGSPLEGLVNRTGLVRGEWPEWDYVLEDPAVDKMCDAYRLIFRAPESAYGGTAHALIALGYYAAVVQRLCPGAVSSGLEQDCARLVTGWNTWLIGAMRSLRDISLTGDAENIASLREEVDGRSIEFSRRIQNIERRLVRHQRNYKVFRFFAVNDALDQSLLLRKLLER
jgi:anaerobic magnesium-protoporphyrin IX monomethyl ester cyclase